MDSGQYKVDVVMNKRLPFTVHRSQNTSAYTLIEILVSLTIIGILFGIGYVSFRDFARRQSIAGAAKVLQGNFRLAQQQALSGQKPSGCGTLDGVRLRINSTQSYAVEAVCNGAVEIFFRSLFLSASRARLLAEFKLAATSVVKIPIIEITTRSSMRVKPV